MLKVQCSPDSVLQQVRVCLQMPAGTHPPPRPSPSPTIIQLFSNLRYVVIYGGLRCGPLTFVQASLCTFRGAPQGPPELAVLGWDTEVPSQHSAVDDLGSGFHLVLPRPFLPLWLGDPVRVYGQQRDSVRYSLPQVSF